MGIELTPVQEPQVGEQVQLAIAGGARKVIAYPARGSETDWIVEAYYTD